ncbi:CAP domain-containing protein [Salibacterium sp. K-3]
MKWGKTLSAAMLLGTVSLIQDAKSEAAENNQADAHQNMIEAIENMQDQSAEKVHPFRETYMDWQLNQADTFLQRLNQIRNAYGWEEADLNEELMLSAQATANYWWTEKAGTNETDITASEGHTHANTNSNYFTGKAPADRMAYYGHEDVTGLSGTEVIAPDIIDAEHGFDRLMSAPYHRMGMLNPRVDKIGVGTNLIQGSKYRSMVAHLSSAETTLSTNGLDAVTYPFDGQTGVPLAWDGEERPDPLQHFDDVAETVGYPITVQKNWDGVERLVTKDAVLYDEEGTEVETYMVDSEKEQNTTGRLNHLIIIPKQPLDPDTTYTVSVEVVEEKEAFVGEGTTTTKEWTFQTVKEPEIKSVGVQNNRINVHTNLGDVEDYRFRVQKEDRNRAFHRYNLRNGLLTQYTPLPPQQGSYTGTLTSDVLAGEDEIEIDVERNPAGELDATLHSSHNDREGNEEHPEETEQEEENDESGEVDDQEEPSNEDEVEGKDPSEDDSTSDDESNENTDAGEHEDNQDQQNDGDHNNNQEDENNNADGGDEEQGTDNEGTDENAEEDEEQQQAPDAEYPESFDGYKQYEAVDNVPADYEFVIHMTNRIDPSTANEDTIFIFNEEKEPIHVDVTVTNNNQAIKVQGSQPYESGSHTLVLTDQVESSDGNKVNSAAYMKFDVPAE